MPAPVIAYVGSAVVLLVLDVIWIMTATQWLYRPNLGNLLSDQPNLVVGGLFYLVYIIGIVVFAVLPAVEAKSWLQALGFGALLGLVAYGTYDITNLSTLRDWPWIVSAIDLCWGIAVSALGALGGYVAVRWLAG